MEDSINCHVNELAKNIFNELTNLDRNTSSVIKINCEKLSKNGELCFLTSRQVWNACVPKGNDNLPPKGILEYYVKNKKANGNCSTYDEIVQKVSSFCLNCYININK